MSLINDALKRTKHAQQQHPPPAGGPPLKAAEPVATKSASGAKTLLYIMVACVVFGNALLFLALKDRGAKKETAAANPPSAPAPLARNLNPSPAIAPQPSPVQPAPASVAAAAPAPVATPVAPETNTAAAAPAAPEPPKPAPLKLQSIIYNPARPSAMISSKFVFIGDKVQGFRVTAIDQETVTLVGNGQTNVLSLP